MGSEGPGRKLRVLDGANVFCLAALAAQALSVDMNGRLMGIPAWAVVVLQTATVLVGIVVAVLCIAVARRPRTWPVLAICVYLIVLSAWLMRSLGVRM